MEFDVPKRERPNTEKYSTTDRDIAYEFAKRLHKEVKEFVRGIVLFGSVARRRQKSHDVDILVVIDDLDVQVTKELVQGYRLIVKKLVGDISTRLHITTMRYTTFWEYIRAGDPVGVNILRDGVPLIDTGFFRPLQLLLYTGRIRPSAESVWNYYSRAPNTINNAKGHVLQAVVDLYWAVIDASHAALMHVGEVPPSPEHVPELLHDKLVKSGLLEEKYPGIVKEFYRTSKNIINREVTAMSGQQYDHYLKLAQETVEKMRTIVDKK